MMTPPLRRPSRAETPLWTRHESRDSALVNASGGAHIQSLPGGGGLRRFCHAATIPAHELFTAAQQLNTRLMKPAGHQSPADSPGKGFSRLDSLDGSGISEDCVTLGLDRMVILKCSLGVADMVLPEDTSS